MYLFLRIGKGMGNYYRPDIDFFSFFPTFGTDRVITS